MQPLLNQRAAADTLGLSERTLERYRVSGEGPPFVKAGKRIMYRPEDIAAWVSARVVASTSEAGGGRQ
jgi:predicted site-specific integrase-resolvase